MKNIRKVLFASLISLLNAAIIYVVIMSQRGEKAFGITILFALFFVFTIGISIFGLVKGKIPVLKDQNRVDSILLLFLSVFFVLYVSSIGFLNILLSAKPVTGTGIPSPKKSISILHSFLDPGYQEDLLTKMIGSHTFRYPKGEEKTNETIDSIERLYPIAKARLDTILGAEASEDLSFRIYLNTTDLTEKMEHNGGVYTPINQTIHISIESPNLIVPFEDSFIHEYTHYRVHLYLKKNQLTMNSLPQWFNEGFAEFTANLKTTVDIELNSVYDFTEMNKNDDFHKTNDTGYNVYRQSYFAVYELVNKYGIGIIPALLQSNSYPDFYKNFKKFTGATILEFQTTFLKDRKERNNEINNLMNKAGKESSKRNYVKAEEYLLDIKKIDPLSTLPNSLLPNIYANQGKFPEALQILKENEETSSMDNGLMAELSLLTSTTESLKYAEKHENVVKKNIKDTSYHHEFADVLRANLDDPKSAYKQLIEKKLINYKTIKNELLKRINE